MSCLLLRFVQEFPIFPSIYLTYQLCFSILYVFRRKEMCKRFEYRNRITVQIGTSRRYVILSIPIFTKYLAAHFLQFYIAVIALQEFSLGMFYIQLHARPVT